MGLDRGLLGWMDCGVAGCLLVLFGLMICVTSGGCLFIGLLWLVFGFVDFGLLVGWLPVFMY